MSMYSMFETDQDLEREGVWNEFYNNEGEPMFRVKLARSSESNTALLARMEFLFKPHRRAESQGLMPLALKRDLTRQAFADTVVRDWNVRRGDEWVRGIEQKDSEELLPVSSTTIEATLKALPELFSALQAYSFDMSQYMEVNREEDAKN